MTIIYFVELTLDQSARIFQGREGIIVIWRYLPATSVVGIVPKFD